MYIQDENEYLKKCWYKKYKFNWFAIEIKILDVSFIQLPTDSVSITNTPASNIINSFL